jgi:hypothetical protein
MNSQTHTSPVTPVKYVRSTTRTLRAKAHLVCSSLVCKPRILLWHLFAISYKWQLPVERVHTMWIQAGSSSQVVQTHSCMRIVLHPFSLPLHTTGGSNLLPPNALRQDGKKQSPSIETKELADTRKALDCEYFAHSSYARTENQSSKTRPLVRKPAGADSGKFRSIG